MGLNAILGFLKWDLKYSYPAYEKYYANELLTAFAGMDGQRKLLVYCFGLYHEKRYAEAFSPLESLLRRSRSDGDRRAVLLAMALCETDLGRTGQAEQHYLELLRYAPEDSTARSNLGLLLIEQGRYLAAEEQLSRAVECDKTNAHARLNLGSLYFRTGQYEKAVPLLKEAAQMNEKLFDAATALSRCYAALEQPQERERYFDLAVQRGQDAARLRRALENTASVLQDEQKMPEEVRKVYREWKRRTGKVSLVAGLNRTPMGRSYVGGPALGQPPLDPEGKPMRQLAAIYCEEFPGVGLPEDGLIRIFLADDASYGLDMEHPNLQRGFRVLYDREYGHLKPGAHPGASARFPVKGQYFLNVHTRVHQPMPAVDFRFQREYGAMLAACGFADPEDELFEYLNDFFHRLGGYPCFWQFDPRKDERCRKYDTLLFQLDSMDTGDMRVMIAGGGVMNFCISAEDLAKGDFSDVLYWWDCP